MNFQNVFRVKLNKRQVIESFLANPRDTKATWCDLYLMPPKGEGDWILVSQGCASQNPNDTFNWPVGRDLAVERAFAMFGKMQRIGLKPIDIRFMDEEGNSHFAWRDVVIFEKGEDGKLLSSDVEGWRNRFLEFAKKVELA